MRTLLILSSLLTAAPALADEVWITRAPVPYERTHFYLGAEGVVSALVYETGSRRLLGSGGGFNLFLGGRVSRRVALEFGWSPIFYGQPGALLPQQSRSGLSLSALSMDLKIYPLLDWVQPYFAIGPSGYLLTDNAFDYLAGGAGWQIGGGVDLWLARRFSIGIKTQYRGVALTDYDNAGSSTYASMLTLGADATGRF
jgi:hypothetical protein